MKIRIENLEKIYHTNNVNVLALDNISLELPKTGFVCICGKNGSGKSSFLNCISLLDEDIKGKIYLDDICINELSEVEKRKIRGNVFGYIFQKNNLIHSLTVEENIKISSTLFDDRINEECLKNDSIPMKQYPNQLSGGQQQKTAIYRALVQNKLVIICDEPTASLDYENTKKVMEMLKEISQDRLVVCVTHDQELIEKYADRTIEFDSGRIKKDVVTHAPALEDIESSTLENATKKVHYNKLIKMGLSFFRKKIVLSICFSIIMTFLFLAIALISSYAAFDSKSGLIDNINPDKIYTPNQQIKSVYANGREVFRDIQISENIIQNCKDYLGEDNFAYSINEVYDGVLFFKNSQIPLGEGSIGTKTLRNIFNKDSLDEPIKIQVSNHLQTIEIKLTSTFEGEGIRCDYETSHQYINHSILVYGGLWRNSKVDQDTMSVECYLETGIVYVPVSYYNSQLGENYIELAEDEAVISENLFQYLDYHPEESSYVKKFIRFEDFSNQDFLYTFVDMNQVFENGMKITSYTRDKSVIGRDNFVIISDSKYKMIEEHLQFFTGVSFYGENNEEKIVNMFLNCNYTFNKDQSSNENIDLLLRLGQELQKNRAMLIVIIVSIGIILLLVAYILMTIILKNDSVKIGIFLCLGLSKIQSLFSSFLTLLFIQFVSIIVSLCIGIFAVKYLNYSFITSLYEAGISIFKIDYKVISILISLILAISAVSLLYLFLSNRKKQIKDYFLVD
ncbi:MAG: ATP-binding cassette domain-containing protein [Anaeroplasmataceae bacterium]|nr:ATP-binding cassette domain-containing protein [Anaeroplasmataceae bacterium]